MKTRPELFRISTALATVSWSGEPLVGDPKGVLLVEAPGDLEPDVSTFGDSGTSGMHIGPGLGEEQTYAVSVESTKGEVKLVHRDTRVVASLGGKADGHYLYGPVSFQSNAGLSSFEVLVDSVLAFRFTVEVFPTKIDYRSDYPQMLADIQAVSVSLAMELLAPTFSRASLANSQPRNSPQEFSAILELMMRELEMGIRQITAAPIWTLDRTTVTTPLRKVRRPNPALARRIIGRGLAQVVAGIPTFDDSRAVEVPLPRPKLDGPEHRWISQRLRHVVRRLEGYAKQLEHPPSEKRRRSDVIRDHLASLKSRLSPLLAAEPLAEASQPISPSFASLALMSKPGYREVYRVLTVLDRGLELEGDPFRAELKDIAKLYEYWCFISLVGLAENLLGETPTQQSLVRLGTRGIFVDIVKGRTSTVRFERVDGLSVELAYNREFVQPGIVLFTQKPDITITIRDPKGKELHLLVDAKYRIERKEDRQFFGIPAPPEDAINALYRYRDAVTNGEGHRTVVEAVAAYPLNADESGSFAQSGLKKAIDSFGIGAIPFLPGNQELMEDWLRSAMRRSGWETAARSPTHVSDEILHDEGRLGEQIALVDVIPAQDRELRLAFFAQGKHYVRLRANAESAIGESKAQRRRLATSVVALYVDGELRLGNVQGVRVLRRSEINTPFPSTASGDPLCILYDLEPGSLERNSIKGLTPRGLRWTSGLALRLAESPEELLVESVVEWRLLRAMRSRGFSVRLQAETYRPEQTGGHTTFVVGSWSARLTASGLWRIRQGAFEGSESQIVDVLRNLELSAARSV